jgi:hypothetical protein
MSLTTACPFPPRSDVVRPAQDAMQLPTVDERTAFNLREKRGLERRRDRQGDGRDRRETVCRLRARFEKKRAALVRLCSGGDCSFLSLLAG